MTVETSAGDRWSGAPWRVRVRDARTARVLGAGMLVGERQVLTCAHVVAGRDGAMPAAGAQFAIDLVELDHQPTVLARVQPGSWVPAGADGSADVVLLDLARHPHAVRSPQLSRVPPAYGREVWTAGYPEGMPGGRSVTATLGASTGPRGEWVQLDPVGHHPPVTPGFSGAAVHDVRTGNVIGMVVGRFDDPDDPLSYMLPLESVLKYLPPLRHLVIGEPAVDPPSLAVPVRPQAPDTAGLAERIADWLAHPRPDPVLVLVVGDARSRDSSVVRRAVALSDREWPDRDAAAAHSPAGTVPPVGSVALDLDVAGLSVAEVTRRVVHRLRPPDPDDVPALEWLRSGAPAVSVVVRGFDDAQDPAALLTRLLGPLVDRGGRLLLALRRPAPPALHRLIAASAAPSAAAVADRLAVLRARLAELEEAERAEEQHRAGLRSRVAPVPPAPDAAVGLRLDLAVLAAAAAQASGPERSALLAKLLLVERGVERALLHVQAVHGELDGDALTDEIDILRRRLEAYAARTAAGGIVEDETLAATYRSAYELVLGRPCDLPAARRAVRSYLAAAHAAIEDRRRTDGRPV